MTLCGVVFVSDEDDDEGGDDIGDRSPNVDESRHSDP